MADNKKATKIVAVTKDANGNIIKLIDSNGDSHTKSQIRRDIKNGSSYVASSTGKSETPIEVVESKNVDKGFYLRSEADGIKNNNLDNLKEI